MYEIVLALHNILRWIVLILGIVVVVRAFLGWFGNREWQESDRKFGSYVTIGIDIQLLLGLLLYFVLSPITKSAMSDFGAAMSVADYRFFALEHPVFMVLALVFAHLGSAFSKRADGDKSKFQRAAIFYALAVLFIILGMPWGRPLFPGLG